MYYKKKKLKNILASWLKSMEGKTKVKFGRKTIADVCKILEILFFCWITSIIQMKSTSLVENSL